MQTLRNSASSQSRTIPFHRSTWLLLALTLAVLTGLVLFTFVGTPISATKAADVHGYTQEEPYPADFEQPHVYP